jgi:hypothetical protein
MICKKKRIHVQLSKIHMIFLFEGKRERRSEESERRTEDQTETEDNVREKETHPEKDNKSG